MAYRIGLSEDSQGNRLAAGTAITIGLVLMVIGATSCARDRTIDDWRREKVGEEVAKIQAVSGRYTGTLHSNADFSRTGNSSVIGEITIDLKPDTRVTDARDRPASEQQATLQGSVHIRTPQSHIISFRNGAFDSARNELKVSIPVKLSPENSRQLELSGSVSGEVLTGRIEAFDFSDWGGHFQLKRTGPASTTQPIVGPGEANAPAGNESPIRKFIGEAQYTDGSTAKLGMVMTDHKPRGDQKASEEQRFYDLLTPIRHVDVNVILFPDLDVPFQNAEWDVRTGTLLAQSSGQSAVGSDRYNIYLSCRQESLAESELGWRCEYWNNWQWMLFKVLFKPVH